jgi:hypothetical protein
VTEIFSQAMRVRCPDPTKLLELIEEWDVANAMGDITAYMGTRVLADRDNEGWLTIIVDFGVIDPDVSAAEEAKRHNDLPRTQAMASAAWALVGGQPEYYNFDEIYRTDR